MSGDAKYIGLYYSLMHQSTTDFYKEISKAPVSSSGGNMNYIPPWVSASASGHYPPHMLPPHHPSQAHSPQPAPLTSSSPLGSPHSHIYHQSLSPVNRTTSHHITNNAILIKNINGSAENINIIKEHLHEPHTTAMITNQTSHSPKSSVHSSIPSPEPSIPSPVNTPNSSVSQVAAAAAAATAAAVAAAVAASAHHQGGSMHHPTASSPNSINHTISHGLDGPYESQSSYYRPMSPNSKLHHPHLDIKSEIPGFHNLPELALGLAGPSAFDPKGHRKYVRRSPPRSPGKYPQPEQLSSPVMFTYQGRGRPRKHFTTVVKDSMVFQGLPSILPVTHPSSSTQEDEESEENKPFKCSICLKGFKLRGGLQQHERTHSSDRPMYTDRPYICQECGKLFRQPTHLQQHMRIHTGEKPYDCTFCDKSFRQRTILNQHLRIHTGEKPYVCMECGKQFRQKAILDQHYRTHLGDKPYACPHPQCRKHFREMASLISHMKCHKDVPDPKIVLQQAKRMIKEEKDEYGHHESLGIPIGSNGDGGDLISISHPGNNMDSSESHENLNDATAREEALPTVPLTAAIRYHSITNNGEMHLAHQRSFASQSPGLSQNQRSPISMHAQPQGGPPTPSDSNSEPLTPQSVSISTHGQSIPVGMTLQTSSSQVTMANLLPYPHSIFPGGSYMMNADSRYQQASAPMGSPTGAENGAHSSQAGNSLSARPTQ